MKKRFYIGDCEITVREIIASISIISVMLLFGVLISGKISERQLDKNEIYNKAIKIESRDLFEYGMRTDVGHAFVYGDLTAVDTVTYPEIGGQYMHVKKIEEHYTMHTQTVTYTDGNGKTHTRTETYWTWDEIGRESIKCKEVSFLGVRFSSSKIDIPGSSYIKTIKESSHVRYKYYGTPVKFTGTIFTELKDKTIKDYTPFYEDMSIEKTEEFLKSEGVGYLVLFWILWIILIAGCVIGFYYIDNNWLE